MRLPRLAVSILLTGGLAGGAAALPAPAAYAATNASKASKATEITITAAKVHEGEITRARARLVDGSGHPLAGRHVGFSRFKDGSWHWLTAATTDSTGRASVPVRLGKYPDGNRVRVTSKAAGGYAFARVTRTLPLAKRSSSIRVGGATAIDDGQRATITARWLAGNDEPVRGMVRFQRRVGGTWRTVATRRTSSSGLARLSVRPLATTRWRLRGVWQPWVRGAVSRWHRVDLRPLGQPVSLPANAPSPRNHPPSQPHAVGAGANPRISRLPDSVWNRMTGISWHRGCPVGRAGLRLLKINYWTYQGYRRRGQIVAATGAIDNMSRALTAMYNQHYPIRSMYLVDRWGYSKKLHGANDYGSMAAGNTSAFNCRNVVGRPGVLSPHAYGGSLDVNTWENPYRSQAGYTPNTWWPAHSHRRVAWRSGGHGVVTLMRKAGMRWTYGLGDTQHFDAAGYGRAMLVPECLDTICH